MGAELNGLFQNTPADGTAYGGSDIVGGKAGHHTVLNMLQQRSVGVKHGAGIDIQISNAQLGNGVHHHVQHKVAVAQMVVEGNGHAVFQAGKLYRFPDGTDQFTHTASLPRPSAWAIAMVRWARITMGASIILPRSAMAPLPCCFARAMASITS